MSNVRDGRGWRKSHSPMHILILGSDPKMIVNFRGPLIEAMLAAGHCVTAAGSGASDKATAWFAKHNVAYIDVPIERNGLNPFADLKTLRAIVTMLRTVKPDLLFASTIKPVVYGLIAARIAGVKRRAAMIEGLGYAFTESPLESAMQRLRRTAVFMAARNAYRLALSFAETVIFLNPDDKAVFARMGLTRKAQHVSLVNGSGVDIARFVPAPFPDGPITFLMIARLLRDKGVYEYVEAARLVKQTHPEARFVLVGPFDTNPSAVKPHEVEAWVREGVIDYKGAAEDVRPHIAACHVFVLPSYREGVPQTVLEAMAMGRPVITTDVPGCRETVRDGQNGIIVPVQSGAQLAQAMCHLLATPEQITKMGNEGNLIAIGKFNSLVVAASTLEHLSQPTVAASN